MRTCPKFLVIIIVATALGLPAQSFSQQFDDVSVQSLKLDQVLTLVSERNEEWQISEQQIQRSRELQRETLALLLPQLMVSASGTRHGGDEVVFQERAIRPRYDWGSSITASIMLFDGQRYPQYARTKELVELTTAETTWRRKTLLLDAQSSFYTLAAAQEDELIARQTVELRQNYFEQAQAMVEAGLALPIDVSRARAQLLEAEQHLLDARANVGNAADALAVLTGHDPGTAFRASISDAQLATPPQSVAIQSFENRDDIVAQALGISATQKSKDAIWWSLLPTLQLQSSARVGPSTFNNPEGYTWSISLALNWLLYDGGARYARSRAIETEIKERQLSLERYTRQSNADLFQALRNWQSTYQAVDLAREQVDIAQQTYDMAVARFEAGLATSIDVTDASQQLFRAQILFNQTKLRANLSAAQYAFLEGVEIN